MVTRAIMRVRPGGGRFSIMAISNALEARPQARRHKQKSELAGSRRGHTSLISPVTAVARAPEAEGPASEDTEPDERPAGERANKTTPRPHSYLSAKCEVRPAPDRGGHTVVAVAPIRRGEVIVIWSGTLVDGEELSKLPASVKRYSLQVEEHHYLVSLSDCEPPDYVNHCCQPNAGLAGQLTLVAMRDIRPGEEVSYDYAMSDGSPYDEFECRCGSPLCRGRVAADDWKRPELWVRYSGYFSPYLQRRIERLKRQKASSARLKTAV